MQGGCAASWEPVTINISYLAFHVTDNYLCVCVWWIEAQLLPSQLRQTPTFDNVKWLSVAAAGASSGLWQTHQREQGKCRKCFFIHEITKDFKMLSVGAGGCVCSLPRARRGFCTPVHRSHVVHHEQDCQHPSRCAAPLQRRAQQRCSRSGPSPSAPRCPVHHSCDRGDCQWIVRCCRHRTLWCSIIVPCVWWWVLNGLLLAWCCAGGGGDSRCGSQVGLVGSALVSALPCCRRFGR